MTDDSQPDGDDGSNADRIPDAIEAFCEEFDLEQPAPGERWEFHLEDVPEGRHIGRELISAGCEQQGQHADGDGRTYKCVVPEPGWPEPLGYVTTEEPEWVSSQSRWKPGKFYGRVRGSIPNQGDCDRHPELPPDAFALTSVSIHAPGTEPRFHAKTTLDVPDTAWAVNLTYELSTGRYSSRVEVYSEELGVFPECTKWESAPHSGDERRRVELFDTVADAVAFVEQETGLEVPDWPEEMEGDS